MIKFQVYPEATLDLDKGEQWRWRAKSANGKIVADGSEAYAEWAYRMGPDDFVDGCFAKVDVETGLVTATGQNKLGMTVTLPLNVPLCKGCDQPLDNFVCHDCSLVFHIDGPIIELTPKDLGNGRWGVEA